jgi:hypothetical protein
VEEDKEFAWADHGQVLFKIHMPVGLLHENQTPIATTYYVVRIVVVLFHSVLCALCERH